MIKIDKEKTIMEGVPIVLVTEFSSLFRSANVFLDNNEEWKETLEELLICDDLSYKEFCQLAVRLNEAHKRVVDKNKRGGIN